jgi:hypothetical protein
MNTEKLPLRLCPLRLCVKPLRRCPLRSLRETLKFSKINPTLFALPTVIYIR